MAGSGLFLSGNERIKNTLKFKGKTGAALARVSFGRNAVVLTEEKWSFNSMVESGERSYLIFIWREGNGHLGHLGNHATLNNRSVTATCALYNASSYKLCRPVFHGQCVIISTLLSWARPTPRRSFNSLIITSLPITLSSSTIESLKSFQSLVMETR